MSFRLPVILNYAKTTEPISLKCLYTLYAFINTSIVPFRLFSTFQDTVCINVLVITTMSNSCISLIKYMRKTVWAKSYKTIISYSRNLA